MLDLRPTQQQWQIKVVYRDFGIPFKKCNDLGDDWHPGWGVNPTHMDDGMTSAQDTGISTNQVPQFFGEQKHLILLTARLFLTFFRELGAIFGESHFLIHHDFMEIHPCLHGSPRS